jgi:hypothetical protein
MDTHTKTVLTCFVFLLVGGIIILGCFGLSALGIAGLIFMIIACSWVGYEKEEESR